MKSPFVIFLKRGTWLKTDDGRILLVYSSSWRTVSQNEKKPWLFEWELSEVTLLEYLESEPTSVDIPKLLANLESGRIQILKSA